MPRPILLAALAVALACACGATPAPTDPAPTDRAQPGQAPGPEELVRVRCATDGSDVVTAWRGTIYAHEPDVAARELFDMVGMNVARCGRDADGWWFASRELMLYLDPETGAVLDRWTNPWTGDEVPVVHVANSPVQGRFTAAPPLERRGGDGSFIVEIAPTYPNPLAGDPAMADYAPQPTYAAIEMFALTAPLADIFDRRLPRVSRMQLSWHRVGPWLPWMKQGARVGSLIYSARGQRVASIDELPAVLRAEIASRLPLYARAPRCLEDGGNATSWRYFARHFAAYQRGERFPIAAPAGPDRCRN